MKNAFLFIAALFMLATSCTNTETDPAINATLVSFTIDAPELQTRVTDGNGESTNRLQYAFYDAQGNHLPALNGIVEGFVGSTTIQIALVEGCSYSALFWADNTAAPYRVDFGNKKMEIGTTTFDGNADKYDAFYKYETNIDPVEKTRKVVLTRPFAQLNIATADTAKAASAGFSAVATEVTVTAHSTLNLATGAVADNDYKTFTYAFAALPTDPAEAKVSGMSYDMLAMNYVLVNERELIDVTMKVSEDAQGTNPIERTYSNVPMQRNYRTYIVGNLLTTENEFNAMISPDWLKDYIYDTNIIVDKIDVEDDKTGNDTEVTLKTKEDWTAKVVFEATRSTEAWCTVEPTNGVAGETILTISTEPNDTGKDRTATVVIKSGESTQEITVKQLAIVASDDEEENPVPNNQIWYTSTDGNIVSPYKTDVFGATIVSNTYENGKGVITFDGDVTEIGSLAFATCATLNEILLPSSITNIGQQAFQQCSELQSMTIPDGVTEIGLQAFAYCNNLQSVTIPDSVTRIGNYAFGLCNNLQSITLHDSVTDIGVGICYENHNFTRLNIHISDLAEYCKNNPFHAIAYYTNLNVHLYINNEEIINLTIPDGVSSIGNHTFSHCTSLQSVTIPESVTEIGEGAFAYCRNIDSISIPSGVTEIKNSTFYICEGLQNISIPESVTKIGGWAFYYCTNLQSIDIPDGVTEIGPQALYECSSLESLIIPEGVTVLKDQVFSKCYNLRDVTIPNSVTKIELLAFWLCKSIQSITIPENVTEIGYGIFYDCINLKTIYCKPATPPSLETSANSDIFPTFGNNAKGRKIYVSAESVEAYKAADGWIDYADYIFAEGTEDDDDEETTTPPNNQIWYTSTTNDVMNLYSTEGFGANIVSNTYEDGKGVITFDGDINTVGMRAFAGTTLMSISLPNSVTSIDTEAFFYCISLEKVTLPDYLRDIGGGAFRDCSSLPEITIPDSVFHVDDYAFFGCTNLGAFYGKLTSSDNRMLIINKRLVGFAPRGLTSYTIPDDVELIGADESIFNWCDKLTRFYGKYASADNYNLVIDSKLYAHAIASGVESYTIPNNVTAIMPYAFSNNPTLKNVIVPEGVTDVDNCAFRSCEMLENVSLPESLTDLGGNTFAYCYSLKNVNLPSKITTIYGNTFLSCTSLEKITIPENVTTVYGQTFYGCNNLHEVYCKPLTPPTIEKNTLYSGRDDFKIYVPSSSLEIYKSANIWQDYADYIFAEGAEDDDDDDEEYVDKVGDPDFQAAIGNKKFVTLQEALNVVEDNQTITLLNRVNLDKMTDILELYRAVNFTLDLDGYRIHSNGNPNYQISREANGMIDINTSKSTDVKNATIIIKNGFLTYNGLRPMIGIAGSTEAQTIVDLENVKISGAVGPDNNISCAVRITHSNATVNIKSGTKISNDREVASSQVNVMHYPLVEVCCGTLNIYEGAEFIYNYVEHANNLNSRDMVVINETSGHTNTAVVNVYGGYGRVAGSCFRMGHNGGLFNIYGGEWIANTDGTLESKISQSSNCVLNMYGAWGYGFTQQTNIYGGILRGSLQALGSGGSGQGSELNISGGNFNADPTAYVVEGHTATQNSQGYWVVE